MTKGKREMFEVEIAETDILCDNCSDLIRQDDYYYRDHESEESLCFYCYNHLFRDPDLDMPPVDQEDNED
jgi:hypothetical protein